MVGDFGLDAKRRAVALLTLSAWTVCVGAADAPRSRLDQYLHAVAKPLPGQATQALQRIDGTPLKLLATRAYLRASDRLQSRWSWSEDQILSYTASDEYRALLSAIGTVQKRFESANPGYQLYANTEVRSLDQQLHKWNSNPSVAKVAGKLNENAVAELNAGSYSARPDVASTRKFAEFLSRWTPPSAVPLAAPGLSLHGQARAIDFQVMKNGKVVAGTEVSAVGAIWAKHGWGRKLQDAVQGTAFKGPLLSPNEPWHYVYQP